MSHIFVNIDKKNRAEEIYDLVTGARRPRSEGETYNKERFTDLFKESDVTSKDRSIAVLFIYKKLGGATISEAQGEVIKNRKKAARKAKSPDAVAKDDDEGVSADGADDDDDE